VYNNIKLNLIYILNFQKARQVFDPSDNNIPKSKLAKRAYGMQPQPPQLQRPKAGSLQGSSPEKTPQKDPNSGGPSSPLSTPSSTPTKLEAGGCVICKSDISSKSHRLIGCKMKNCENQGENGYPIIYFNLA